MKPKLNSVVVPAVRGICSLSGPNKGKVSLRCKLKEEKMLRAGGLL